MLLRTEEAQSGSRATVFALGGLVALASFAFLGWDLLHHRTPYVPGAPLAPPSALHRYSPYINIAWSTWLMWRARKRKSQASEGYWPRRNSFLSAPEPDNAGAVRAHPSESANGDPRM